MQIELMETASTWYGRPLTRKELILFCWCGCERTAVLLAKHCMLSEEPSAEEISDTVTRTLCTLYELINGPVTVEYVTGRNTTRRVI